ncbi:orotidine 5'-phosphate decarboxylase [Candidatus Kaiserbacteria bacterium RIFCSPLOWO2_01_FULL_51_21]|uniref:Orotidine 5'-phosphate decarboxylase n=1 Tax=Candidatus Kaiserbacteria bacterium RIFCSPLOWO2_01_FULL_51_21 TaxID=1798508 RepID=A0A1F6ED76_9BACT|nr:MAG: orotidine 5'-phosphate decarboxylase [Candidatus Kaiserbacteria bacterium RIFCSPLOWO2_01_FULL_51_21]
MERCDKATEEKNIGILALDNMDFEDMLSLIDPLRPSGCIIKVNDYAFAYGFLHAVRQLSIYGRVFLDLKLKDIPNTVANTCKKLLAAPPWALTVHCDGGKEMVQAAVKTLEGTGTKILGVTVLTSINDGACNKIYGCLSRKQVLKLAAMADEAGVHGLVCSAHEVKELRALYPKMELIVPGARSPGAATNDQERVATPREAKDAGADYLVFGRQVTGNKNPIAELRRIHTEELGIQLPS